MKYKNIRTGVTLETECDIRGDEWQKVEPKSAGPAKKKAEPAKKTAKKPNKTTKKTKKETEGGKK